MKPTPVLDARRLIKALRKLGFVQTRARGSHRRLEHPDGRKTTVPVHKGRDIPRGLLRQIVTLDLGMDMDEFTALL
jgi:predicted RNA binding protein YcfA (HicA-like mRNA interferase family)